MTNLIEPQLRVRAAALLAEGVIDLFLGYRPGSNPLRMTPFAARTSADAERLVWNALCVPNLAGMLQKHAGKRIGLILKGCDALSVAELIRLHQVDRQQLHIIGVACDGMADPERIAALASAAVDSLAEEGDLLLVGSDDKQLRVVRSDVLLAKCATCSCSTPLEGDALSATREVAYDEFLGDPLPPAPVADRFAEVRALEALAPAERLAFWSEHLARCTLCYACQTVCPLCFCKQCALTLPRNDPRRQQREPSSVFAFHLMRAYHLADRCTGCDECERVCPEDIPLHLICRKIEQDRGTL